MRADVAARLAGLSRLDRKNAVGSAIPCKVCGAPAPFFDVVDFQKCVGFYAFGPSGVSVPYHRCGPCGFLFTPFFDDWLHSDFARFIYNADYAALDPDYASLRPKSTAETMSRVLSEYRDARILDYGAGSGVFAECMAELGFPHVTSYDPFSMPARPSGKFDIAVCIEVIEHSPNPAALVSDVASFLAPESCILLGESLQPAEIDSIRGNWWYIAPRNGHVSTFADRTFVELARQNGLIFHRGGFAHALRPPHSGAFLKLADKAGPALACYRLGAPGRWPADGFNGVEGIQGDQFQWTASETVSWRVTVPPGPERLVQVLVPYSHQSRVGFAAECRLEIGGIVPPVSIRESSVFAEAGPIAPGEITVTLHTPELKSAPGDGRRLGLALQATGHAASEAPPPPLLLV
jgi:SAM-dependent methyltransferase